MFTVQMVHQVTWGGGSGAGKTGRGEWVSSGDRFLGHYLT